jgi:hypothetical protein
VSRVCSQRFPTMQPLRECLPFIPAASTAHYPLGPRASALPLATASLPDGLPEATHHTEDVETNPRLPAPP